MRIIELMLGGIIVVSTLVDIFQSVVVPRPTRGSIRLAPFLLDGKWPLWKWIAFRFPLAKYRTAFLGYHAPLTVVMLLLVWGIALILGYGLLFLSGCQLANDLKDYFKISPAQAQAGNPKKALRKHTHA